MSTDRNEIFHDGDLQEVVLTFEFHQNRSSGFGAVGSKFALSH